jgi:hypothetical protein
MHTRVILGIHYCCIGKYGPKLVRFNYPPLGSYRSYQLFGFIIRVHYSGSLFGRTFRDGKCDGALLPRDIHSLGRHVDAEFP